MNRVMHFRLACVAPLAALVLAGCGDAPSRVVPEYPASDSGAAAVKLLDANGDGVLLEAEMDKAPGLKAAVPAVDANSDGGLSATEIDRRIQAWADSKVG